MVTRLYFCKDCGHEFETVQPMHEELLKVCFECNGTLAQDLTGIHTSVKQYKTLGALAEKNAKDLGRYGREKKEKELRDEMRELKKVDREKMAQYGIKPFETENDSNIKIKGPPKSVLDKLERGDDKGVKDYIFKGKT